jgi:hypothetical protein
VLVILYKGFVQGIFLQPVGFSHHPLNAISIYRPFKIAAANTHTSLQQIAAVMWHPKNLERKIRKILTPTKDFLYGLAAF